MMGMGFLRLNKILAKHKWSAEEKVANEEQARLERKYFFVALVIVALFVTAILYLF